jgi:hypothetical protein
MTPRQQAGRLGGLTTRSRHTGREMTAAARAGQLARFGREVDAAAEARGERLSAEERATRVAAAQRAWMLKLAMGRRKGTP